MTGVTRMTGATGIGNSGMTSTSDTTDMAGGMGTGGMRTAGMTSTMGTGGTTDTSRATGMTSTTGLTGGRGEVSLVLVLLRCYGFCNSLA